MIKKMRPKFDQLKVYFILLAAMVASLVIFAGWYFMREHRRDQEALAYANKVCADWDGVYSAYYRAGVDGYYYYVFCVGPKHFVENHRWDGKALETDR